MYIIKYFNEAYQSYLNGIGNNFFIEIFIEKCMNYISSKIKYYSLSKKPYPKSDPIIFNNIIVGYFHLITDTNLTLSLEEEINYKIFLLYLGILIYNSKYYPINLYSNINYNFFIEIINSLSNNIIITTNNYDICYHNTNAITLLQSISSTQHIAYKNISMIHQIKNKE